MGWVEVLFLFFLLVKCWNGMGVGYEITGRAGLAITSISREKPLG